jgi:hypothetical protein
MVGVVSPDTLIEVAMSPDGMEGLRPFREKRETQWPASDDLSAKGLAGNLCSRARITRVEGGYLQWRT